MFPFLLSQRCCFFGVNSIESQQVNSSTGDNGISDAACSKCQVTVVVTREDACFWFQNYLPPRSVTCVVGSVHIMNVCCKAVLRAGLASFLTKVKAGVRHAGHLQ